MGSVAEIPEDEVAEPTKFDMTLFRRFTEPETWRALTLHQHVALLVWTVQQRGLMEKHTPYVGLSEKSDGTFLVHIVSRDGQGSRSFTAGPDEVIRRLLQNVLGEVRDKYKSTVKDFGVDRFELAKVEPPVSPVLPDATPAA